MDLNRTNGGAEETPDEMIVDHRGENPLRKGVDSSRPEGS